MAENKIKDPVEGGGSVEDYKAPKKKIKSKPSILGDNKLREPLESELEKEKTAPVKKRKVRPSRMFVRFMNIFGIFDRNQIVKSMPFILFLSVLIICYIANSYYAERVIREIDKTKTDLKEKRAEYISTMSRLMYQSNQSEVAKSLSVYEVKESIEPPGKIFITEKSPKK